MAVMVKGNFEKIKILGSNLDTRIHRKKLHEKSIANNFAYSFM